MLGANNKTEKQSAGRVLRLIKGVTRRDRLKRDDKRDELNVEPILLFIEGAQFKVVLTWHTYG